MVARQSYRDWFACWKSWTPGITSVWWSGTRMLVESYYAARFSWWTTSPSVLLHSLPPPPPTHYFPFVPLAQTSLSIPPSSNYYFVKLSTFRDLFVVAWYFEKNSLMTLNKNRFSTVCNKRAVVTSTVTPYANLAFLLWSVCLVPRSLHSSLLCY